MKEKQLNIFSGKANSPVWFSNLDADPTCTTSQTHPIIFHGSYSDNAGFCSHIIKTVCVALTSKIQKATKNGSYSSLEPYTSNAILPHSAGGLWLKCKVKWSNLEALPNVTLNPEKEFKTPKN